MEELQVYLSPEFNPVEYARSLLSNENSSAEGRGVEDCWDRLRRQRDDVESALSAHVADNNEELMSKLTGTEDLKSGVQANKDHANALSASLGRLRRDVSDPFTQMKRDTKRLRNIHRACKVLDRTRRFLRSVGKLKALFKDEENESLKLPNSGRELAKSAQILHDVEYLVRTGELDGIVVVESERKWLENAGKGVRVKTEAVLNKAIVELNQSEIGSALQAFFNLGVLPERVDAAVSQVVANIAEEARNTFDAHILSEAVELSKQQAANENSSAGSGGLSPKLLNLRRNKRKMTKASNRIKPPSGEEKLWKNRLWQRVEALESSVRTWSLRVWNLQRVLSKKRDPITHVCFADQVYSAKLGASAQQHHNEEKAKKKVETVYERYWRLMTQALHGQVENGSRSYPFVRNVLGVQGYPRLRALFRALPSKLAQRTAGKSVASVGGSNEEVHAILRALQPLLELFLAQSHHRLKETVELMFPEVETLTTLPSKQNALPTRNDVVTFAKTISTELSASKGDVDLFTVIARGAANSVSLFSSKAEAIIVMDENAFTFYGIGEESPVDIEMMKSRANSGAAAPPIAPQRTQAQIHNVAVLKLVLKLQELLKDILESTSKTQALLDAIQRLRAVAVLVLDEYLAAAARALNRVIGGIHAQSFCGSASGIDGESIYMTKFSKAVELLSREHLQKLPVEYEIIGEYSRKLQARVVSMFVRNISLVRPLDSQGRFSLTNDLAQFELAVAPLALSSKLEQIGEPYVELRAFRQLLFLLEEPPTSGDVDQVIEKYKTLSNIRVTNLLHSIFATAPAVLRSPYQVTGSNRNLTDLEEVYCSSIDQVEEEVSKSSFLVLGTTLKEPPEVKKFVWEKVSHSLDKYIQMTSVDPAQKEKVCAEYQILTGLRVLVD